jgi:hypothetical protein
MGPVAAGNTSPLVSETAVLRRNSHMDRLRLVAMSCTTPHAGRKPISRDLKKILKVISSLNQLLSRNISKTQLGFCPIATGRYVREVVFHRATWRSFWW